MGNSNEAFTNIIRKELKTFASSKIAEAIKYHGFVGGANTLSDDEVSDVLYTIKDWEAEEYAAKMRAGHGIGCYCGYCCM